VHPEIDCHLSCHMSCNAHRNINISFDSNQSISGCSTGRQTAGRSCCCIATYSGDKRSSINVLLVHLQLCSRAPSRQVKAAVRRIPCLYTSAAVQGDEGVSGKPSPARDSNDSMPAAPQGPLAGQATDRASNSTDSPSPRLPISWRWRRPPPLPPPHLDNTELLTMDLLLLLCFAVYKQARGSVGMCTRAKFVLEVGGGNKVTLPLGCNVLCDLCKRWAREMDSLFACVRTCTMQGLNLCSE
jgi:hypothetical protein